MKKIISLFRRNYEGDRLVRDELVLGAEWVVAGEGVATIKWGRHIVPCARWGAVPALRCKNGKPRTCGGLSLRKIPIRHRAWPGWIAGGEGNPADRWHLGGVYG